MIYSFFSLQVSAPELFTCTGKFCTTLKEWVIFYIIVNRSHKNTKTKLKQWTDPSMCIVWGAKPDIYS